MALEPADPSKHESSQPTTKIIVLRGITRLDLPANRILEQAINADLQGVVVLGYGNDGKEYMVTSYADGGVVTWLLERCKHRLMVICQEEESKHG